MRTRLLKGLLSKLEKRGQHYSPGPLEMMMSWKQFSDLYYYVASKLQQQQELLYLVLVYEFLLLPL